MSLKTTFARAVGALRPAADVPARPGPFTGVCALIEGQGWRSDNGRAELRLKRGKLVLMLDGRAAWSPPVRERVTKALMNGDGQFLVFSGYRRQWSVGRDKAPAAEFRVQDDGNLVIYDGHEPVWVSGTALH